MPVSSGLAFAASLTFAGLALLGPGLALQRIFRVRVDPCLVLPLGTAVCAGVFWLSLVLDQAPVFPAGILLLDLVLLARLGPWRQAEPPSLRGALPPCLALVAFLAATAYPWNHRSPEGDFLLDPLVPYDTAFHVGLTRELTLGYPPQIPGVSGFPIGYHFGIDLVRAAALRWAGIDPFDSVSRLDATLGVLALVLALRAITHRLGAPPAAVTLAPWTLLLTDFSFVFAPNPQAHWWTDLLRGNLLVALAVANPIVPALAMALGALCAFSRYQAGEGRGHLALAGARAGAVPRGRPPLRSRHRHARLRPGRRDRGGDGRAPRPGGGDAREPPAGAPERPRVPGLERVLARRIPRPAPPRTARRLARSPERRDRRRRRRPRRREPLRLAARPALPRLRAGGPARPEDRERRGLSRRAGRSRVVDLHRDGPGGLRAERTPPRAGGGGGCRARPSLDRPVRPQEAGDTGRPHPGRDGEGDGCAGGRVTPGGGRPAASGRTVPPCPGDPGRPARPLRTLHSVPDPVRAASGPAGPARDRLPVLPQRPARRSDGHRTRARGALRRALRPRAAAVRHRGAPRVDRRRAGGPGLSDQVIRRRRGNNCCGTCWGPAARGSSRR